MSPESAGGLAAPRREADRRAGPRLQRLLALVPWVLAHPHADVDQVCERFGITSDELVADLELLFVVGLPPYGPGDLIEAWVEGDRVHISLADYLAEAPRLTWREAAGLYLAGRALSSLPGVDPGGALARALAKLEAVLPADQLAKVHDLAGRVAVDLEGAPGEAEHRVVLVEAAAARRRVRLEYVAGAGADHTERTVDPWVVFSTRGHWYLAGYCHRAGGERLFRLDRVISVTPTDEPFELPEGFDAAGYGEANIAVPLDRATVCTLDLAPRAEWAAGHFRASGSDRRPDGRLRVRLAAHDLSWVVGLVLRLAPDAEPVDPPELRSAVKAAALDSLAAYVDDG